MNKLRIWLKVGHPVVTIQLRKTSSVLRAFRSQDGIAVSEFLKDECRFFDAAASLDIEVVAATNFVCNTLHEHGFLGEYPRIE